jgi:indolepyruvate decarboxylase
MTVIEYVLSRLRQIGVADIFGVPGDFSFPINDAICLSKEIRWIGCSNELNAAYAADGYARVRGVGAVCTTYGVGELSAINGIAGSYAERLPVFHLVGMPNQSTQEARALMHHTLGNGAYELFYQMTEPVVCARSIITPQNVVFQTERLIAEALYRRRPVYLAFPADLAQQPVLGAAQNPFEMPRSDLVSLNAAVEAIVGALLEAKTACVPCPVFSLRAPDFRGKSEPLSMPRTCRLPPCSWISRLSTSSTLTTLACMKVRSSTSTSAPSSKAATAS